MRQFPYETSDDLRREYHLKFCIAQNRILEPTVTLHGKE